MDRQHDIQPCGSNEAIAYYIEKYLPKAEPEGVDSGIAQAIQQIQREKTDISRKLFKICMKILHERQVSALSYSITRQLAKLHFSENEKARTALQGIAIRQKRTRNWLL